ncbi:hypothetical protein ATK36_3897 [Amycolatopsis sulphurea]|uniref:Uncharacterized protein n=1 Tax=Amycolatopsis sulphurea TaxID=76022 RepID=A0A2A9FBI7_9PSEU|nr:hypothetical protein ATK36_3897 [Amycolatopsis sulphurea]
MQRNEIGCLAVATVRGAPSTGAERAGADRLCTRHERSAGTPSAPVRDRPAAEERTLGEKENIRNRGRPSPGGRDEGRQGFSPGGSD